MYSMMSRSLNISLATMCPPDDFDAGVMYGLFRDLHDYLPKINSVMRLEPDGNNERQLSSRRIRCTRMGAYPASPPRSR
ncbi:hypothetical protein BDN70DRAFT_289179 [Pholiota conissans]|uniref:Uncharacterized protein n=1 Tax=Pholiota conissans TaxID=109636 RepID=A0A9P5YVX4_9AGAR|nr:hypothetical protein BDN70DRAFT_289179 [Pholiota conissans]